jgi:hypothetical protein
MLSGGTGDQLKAKFGKTQIANRVRQVALLVVGGDLVKTERKGVINLNYKPKLKTPPRAGFFYLSIGN